MTRAMWIRLKEYETTYLRQDDLSPAGGERLWSLYKNQVSVEFPTVKTGYRWEITPLGYVGYIPLTGELGFHIEPKVPLKNLFRMFEYAYKLESFRVLDGVVDCDSLQEFYEQLAKILALRVISREKKGLYRTYVDRVDRMPYLRGRIDVRWQMDRPWATTFLCEYQDHLADIDDNRILLWTLHTVARTGLCSETVSRLIRKAYRNQLSTVTLVPYSSRDCTGRQYNRLNSDYLPLHALCRFFLDQSGPAVVIGDRPMVPFLVDMAGLFELFVAERLKKHLPDRFRLEAQEQVNIDLSGGMTFRIDLVLYDRQEGSVRCVIDTKYKTSRKPTASDFHQAVSYAVAKGCGEAILVYPTADIDHFDSHIGGIRVRNLAFPIDDVDIERAGEALLASLVGSSHRGLPQHEITS